MTDSTTRRKEMNKQRLLDRIESILNITARMEEEGDEDIHVSEAFRDGLENLYEDVKNDDL